LYLYKILNYNLFLMNLVANKDQNVIILLQLLLNFTFSFYIFVFISSLLIKAFFRIDFS
jgi:hypothetical protein